MDNISNSTRSDDIRLIFSRIDKIPFSLLFFFLFSLCILSFAWSIYLLSRLIKERQYLKCIKGSRNSMREQVWLTKVRNSNTKIVKNTFLFIISSTEWISVFLIIFCTFYDNKYYIFKPSDAVRPLQIDVVHALYPTHRTSELNRVFSIYFIILSLFIPLTLLRILTQYLCQQYTFYFDPSFSLRRKFILPITVLILILLLGLFRQLMIFEWASACVYFAYEFVCLTIATNRLRNLLYKRYFDAKTHEYQAIFIIRYYRWSYLEFKFCSCLLLASMFFQILSYILFPMFSLFGIVLISSNDWIQMLFMNVETIKPYLFLQPYHQLIEILEYACNSVLLICMCVAWGLLVLPYGLVSLNFCLNCVKTRIESSKDYPNHELIRKLISKHYSPN